MVLHVPLCTILLNVLFTVFCIQGWHSFMLVLLFLDPMKYPLPLFSSLLKNKCLEVFIFIFYFFFWHKVTALRSPKIDWIYCFGKNLVFRFSGQNAQNSSKMRKILWKIDTQPYIKWILWGKTWFEVFELNGAWCNDKLRSPEKRTSRC